MCPPGAREGLGKKTVRLALVCVCVFTEDLENGRQRRGLCGSARNVDAEYWASLSLKCTLATVTGEGQAHITWLVLCPSPSLLSLLSE